MARHQVWDGKGKLIIDEYQPDPPVIKTDRQKIEELEAKLKATEALIDKLRAAVGV